MVLRPDQRKIGLPEDVGGLSEGGGARKLSPARRVIPIVHRSDGNLRQRFSLSPAGRGELWQTARVIPGDRQSRSGRGSTNTADSCWP
ncbi:hypothetical protein CHELA40_15431 [Chelatococcus asaccharovorans]|nr:hypothetical protein CHELA17_60186 [Chelatococcus asaccharovorans]CAH1682494.1 hypothetical protein CHELA40_15431 [Chelatococcus asaccharovorans]